MRALGLLFSCALPALVLWGVAGCEFFIDGQVTSIHCADEGKIGPNACPEHYICEGGSCINLAQRERKLGNFCEQDSDCAFGDFCLDPEPLALSIGRRCTRSCCSSSGCDPAAGSICWSPSGGGGSFCIDAVILGRAQGGKATSGERCSSDSDCRSGLCAPDGICIDPCCSDSSCAAAEGSCQLRRRGEEKGFFCGPRPEDKAAYLSQCNHDDDCASGLCHDFGDELGRRCSTPCCNSDACNLELMPDLALRIACTYVPIDGRLIRACAQAMPAAMVNGVGQSCQEDDECRGGRCVRPSGDGEPGYCSDACCADAGCGDGSELQCRPNRTEDAWPLRCERK
jgi:hypothetical protein